MNSTQIADNLESVRRRIQNAAVRAGRDPDAARLVAVSKTFAAAAVIEALRAGQTEFGENRVQEGEPKIAEVAAAGFAPRWHLIGSLQSNKVQRAVHNFAIIESVDSLRLAQAISRRVAASFPVLVEINVAGEASKGGLKLEEAEATIAAIRSLPNLAVLGLMTVAPRVEDSEDVRPVFRRLAALARRLELNELSMGMSADFEVAIEEGATIVRVGSAIFGHRGT